MKSANATKLGFAKNSLVELNDNQMQDVNGGSTPLCYIAIGALLAYALD
ncbi:class IIb bacteriocin, lactobin A/cerein 7B family [Flavobacterium sp. CAU 1735]